MESFFGAMSGFGILLAIGYLLLTIFIIVYFFRMANDIRKIKESTNIELQEEQIQLQKETIKLLEKLVNKGKNLSIIDAKTDKTKEIQQENYQKNYSNEEIEVINSKISLLKENEIIVIHPLSRVIKRIHKSEFDESRGWIIVKEFEK